MYAAIPVWAWQANTRGSRGNDRELEQYLRTEFRGGTTLAALLSDPWMRKYARRGTPAYGAGPQRAPRLIQDRMRAAVVRMVTTVMVYLRRVRPVEAGPGA